MPVSADVMELVELLNEEGFGFLAGELLTEISLGREIEDDGDLGSAIAASDLEGAYDDAEPPREPIPEAEQLGEALIFLEARLVEPIRHLADAEAIAGCLAVPRDPNGQPDFKILQQTETPAPGMPGAPMSIAFQPPPDRKDERLYRAEAPGTARAADLLSRVLQDLVREDI